MLQWYKSNMKTEKYKKLQQATQKDYKTLHFSLFHPCNKLTVLNAEQLEIPESRKILSICSSSRVRS